MRTRVLKIGCFSWLPMIDNMVSEDENVKDKLLWVFVD